MNCTQERLPATTVAALAPTGALRASINLGNPVLARRESGSAQVSGISVDLAQALAAHLGVGIELSVFDAAAKSVEAVRSGQADVGFFAIDPARGEDIAFTAPYLLIEGAYLVRQDSPLRDNAQVDQPGTRVMVGKGSAYDLFLSRELKSAQIRRAPTPAQVIACFLEQDADVAAGIRPQLAEEALRHGGLRLLPGCFMVIKQAMGVPASRDSAARMALCQFVEWAKSSGFVAQALDRHKISGARVALAA